jgi:hypothetical protein
MGWALQQLLLLTSLIWYHILDQWAAHRGVFL